MLRLTLEEKGANLRHKELQVVPEGRGEIGVDSAVLFEVCNGVTLMSIKSHQVLYDRKLLIILFRRFFLASRSTSKNLRALSTFGTS